MRSLRYLNTILTVLTVLLAMQLWTSWIAPGSAAGHHGTAVENHDGGLPALITPVQAQVSDGSGIPNAGAQRKDMIDLLKKQTQQMDQLMALLKSGEVRVRAEGGSREGK